MQRIMIHIEHNFLLLFLFNYFLYIGCSPAQNEVMVLEGYDADIPCVTLPLPPPNKTAVVTSDRPTLILWYKDGVKSSIYSYDGRNRDNERHWSSRRSMGGALRLTLPASPNTRPQLAFLSIGHAHPTDAGVYHCRVDFKKGPGRSTYTNLTVVSPPSSPTVEVWAGGRWLHTTHETSSATVEVGTKLSLRCSTSGGNPVPTVTWWRGGQQLLGEETTQNGLVSSSVNVTVVSEDAHTPIVCQASNTHLIPPLRTPLLLLVLSPPTWLRIVGADRPMSAGMTYTVECRCMGARPPPVITWTVGGDELDHATATTDAEGKTISILRFTPKPAHFGTHITCTARPPDHAYTALSPHSTPNVWLKSDSVPLNVLYKPEVNLNLQVSKALEKSGPKNDETSENRNVASTPGGKSPFTPSAKGGPTNKGSSTSNPSATKVEAVEVAIRNDDEVEGTDKKEEKQDEKGIKNDGKLSTKGEISNDKRITKNGDSKVVIIEEFVGVVLQCNVRANPPAYHVSWHRNGIPLSPITSPGLLVGNMSVVFPNLKRSDAGNLTCTAHNTEGSTRSNPVQLNVKHGPECVRKTANVIGVPRHHALNVTCEVEAYPLPTTFTWALRSTRGILAVPPEMISFSGTTSWIAYTPRANVDFGDLLCWAHTANGRQSEPCISQLVSAEKPDTPEDCKVTKRTPHKLTVKCKAAYDGGLPQTFFMRVFHAGLQVTNSSSVTPEINVYDLEPDTRYRLTLWSANPHGTSTGHTTLYTSTQPSNSSSTTSSMNGHSSSNHNGLLAKFGSSILAVVVVVTVIGVVIGIVVGIMVQRIDGRDNHSSHTEDDEGEELPPTLVNNNQINVAMAGIGRRTPKCLEPLGKSTTHYDIVTVSGVRHDLHVYDDPISLREDCNHIDTPDSENIEVTHNFCYPTFSITPADLGYQSQNFSWHLPNSRLLRSKFNQRYPIQPGSPRKPVRVESPKLPEFDISTTITTRKRIHANPGMEFRLILVPETSKMIQVALERDTRLASYLANDTHLSNTSVKFPTINEEEETKATEAVGDISCQEIDVNSATPYESTPDELTVENGQSDTSELLLSNHDLSVANKVLFHSTNRGVNNKHPTRYNLLQPEPISESMLDDLEFTSEHIPRITIFGNCHKSKPSSRDYGSSRNHNPSKKTRSGSILQNKIYAKPLKTSKSASDAWEAEEEKMSLALLGHRDEEESYPSQKAMTRYGRHHPYGIPIACIKKSAKTPPPPSMRKKNSDPVNPTGVHFPHLMPTSPFSLLRKPKVGVTSLLSLVSSTSSSSSSTYCSKRCQGSRETTTSPLSENRRRVSYSGVRRSSFKNLKSRPKSIHFISGPEQVSQCRGETDCHSASTPSSPRSSTSSSSCFPYSSMSSSPISSFYSSENELSISATFSHTSSSSSFCFSSASSSVTSSSSPFSSFLSPSLTSPSSSSGLSLSSCSPTPDSVLSGHITPT